MRPENFSLRAWKQELTRLCLTRLAMLRPQGNIHQTNLLIGPRHDHGAGCNATQKDHGCLGVGKFEAVRAPSGFELLPQEGNLLDRIPPGLLQLFCARGSI